MQKLIYVNNTLSEAKKWLGKNGTAISNTVDWDKNTNIYYRSLVFTQDGHLITHGLDFSSAASWGLGLIFNAKEGSQATASAPTADGKFYIPKFKNDVTDGMDITWELADDIITNAELNTWAGTNLGFTVSNGSITSDIVSVSHGGTGLSTLTKDLVLIGNGTDAVTFKAITSSVTDGSSDLVTSGGVYSAISAGFAANDAMMFKGTIALTSTGTNKVEATVYTLPTKNYSAGFTYRVVEAGTYAGKVCEIGDLIISITDRASDYAATEVTNDDWTVALTNIDGAIVITGGAATNLTANGILYATGNKTVNSTAVGNAGLYLKSTGTGTPTWATFLSLSLFGLTYEPYNKALSITCGAGLQLTTGKVLGHSNSVTKLTTEGLYTIKHDIYGHITGSTSWDPSTITFSNVYTTRTGTTDAEDDANNKYFYSAFDPDGQAVTIKAADGLNLYADTTNHAIVIGHSSSKATSNTSNSGRTYILSLTLDDYGHVTGISTASESVINTWRPIYAWKLSEMATAGDTIDLMVAETTGTRALAFSSAFGYAEKSVIIGTKSYDIAELDLVWAEVDDKGTVTYAF